MHTLDSGAPTRRREQSANSGGGDELGAGGNFASRSADEVYHETAVITPSESTPLAIVEAQTETSNVVVRPTESAAAFSGEPTKLNSFFDATNANLQKVRPLPHSIDKRRPPLSNPKRLATTTTMSARRRRRSARLSASTTTKDFTTTTKTMQAG